MTAQQAIDYNILLELKERVESKYKNRINIINKKPRIIFMSNIEENKISDEAKQRAKNYMSLKGALEPKQETLEEAAETWVNNRFTKQICGDKSYPDIYASKKSIIESHIIFAKSQGKIMYSEEDVIAIVEKSRETGLTAEYLLLTEQFKKK